MDLLNAKGDSPLSIAAANGFKDLVQFLLSQKSKVNHRNSQGLTPIFQASMNRSEFIYDAMHAHCLKITRNVAFEYLDFGIF